MRPRRRKRLGTKFEAVLSLEEAPSCDAPAPQPTSNTRSPVTGAAVSIAAGPNTATMASSRA